MLGFSRAQSIGFVILLLVVIAAPFVLYPIVVMQVMCYALFAMGTNLLMGSVGLLSLGQAAYFGLGGYVAGYLVQTVGLTPELGIIAGGLAGALLGAAFGWLAIRRQDIYFAMITLALAQIVYFAAVQATGFTGGENGIQGIPRGALFGHLPLANDRAMYALVAVIFLAGVLFIHRVIHSPFGQVVKAVRDNEPRTISLGYRSETYKGVSPAPPRPWSWGSRRCRMWGRAPRASSCSWSCWAASARSSAPLSAPSSWLRCSIIWRPSAPGSW
jgi:branched-chain amino acid transport system permease protein